MWRVFLVGLLIQLFTSPILAGEMILLVFVWKRETRKQAFAFFLWSLALQMAIVYLLPALNAPLQSYLTSQGARVMQVQ